MEGLKTDTFSETWIRSQRISVYLNISNSTRVPKQQRIFRVSGNFIALSAQNGLRASTAWLLTAKEAHIREGAKLQLLRVLAMLTVHRVKALKDEPYTQKEAEAAIGRQAPKERPTDVEVEMENSGLMEDVAI
jgi:hypothetical protein